MGCETPDIVRTYQRERLVIQASGGPGPSGQPGPPGQQGAPGVEGPPGPQGVAGDNNINAQGPLSYDPNSGALVLGPITLNGGSF